MIPHMVDVAYKPYFSASSVDFPDKPRKIDWQALCILYGKRITASKSAPGDDEIGIVYTVPAGAVFLLLTATLSIAGNDLVKRTSSMWIQTSGGEQPSVTSFMKVSASPDGQGSVAISPAVPLILRTGEKITVNNEEPENVTSGAISGYEIDATLFSRLIQT